MSNSGFFKRLKRIFTCRPTNREEITTLLRQTASDEIIDSNTLNMLEGVLQVQETRVKDAMVPRLQMVTIENYGLYEILPLVMESGHSRFPVLGENKDEVIGILLAKDLLSYVVENPTKQFNLRELLHPAAIIPESKRLNVLLQDFRLNRSHMAIVVDEYGRITGLITIEDVLEQIVGEIEDEHDTESASSIRAQADGTYTVKALTPLDEFNEYFDSDLGVDGAETIGGVIMLTMGHVPKRGESIDIDDYQFTVLRSDNRRVHLLSVTPPERKDPD